MIMHSIHIPFIAILLGQIVCVPQVPSQITSPLVPTATASSNTSSIAIYPVCAVSESLAFVESNS